jgi:hypothetical protein
MLSKEQKEDCFRMCQDLQERFERDPEFLLKIITCDETWVEGYKVETNHQLSLWKSPSSPCPESEDKFIEM